MTVLANAVPELSNGGGEVANATTERPSDAKMIMILIGTGIGLMVVFKIGFKILGEVME